MKTEKILTKTSGRCLNVTASKVDSLRINEDIYSTVRVYDGGFIGVEGRLGNADFGELETAAKAKLAQKIPYPETHDEKPLALSVNTDKRIIDERKFVPTISALLERMQKENPEFLFGNKVLLNSDEVTYENSDGTKLHYKGGEFTPYFTIKYKGSANIMDESYGVSSDYYDEDEICRDAKLKCDAFLNELPQIDEDEVTVIGDFEPINHAMSHFLADLYYNNSSIFNGKLGEKIFNEKFSLVIDRNPDEVLNVPFFDAEGVVNKGYKNYLVKNGVLSGLLTCKKSAAQYGAENIGSASAPYDGVPSFGGGGITVENTAESLDELVKGKAIYLSVSSGGDMTPSGDISMPAIVAYLYEDGKLVGKLPEFTVTGNLFDIFGKDFIGVCKKGFYSFGKNKYFVYKAKIVNKK